ncbi:LCP family protein [Actinomadura rupiterrae]|uniref:LCP family protein n=1 Tax=Actinomadura rupiterrae TaxID=559627 RepID=UPI0020A3A3D7|nr:LCP family protein [Actinomadura rupiterrae]MCP2338649.1 LCP family protein required for cell wall assembly [Actinomadura rupiterrae]
MLGGLVYAVACAAAATVLVASGLAYFVLDNLRGLGSSHAIGNAPKSTDGATNILLIGLDSRKDQNGDPLPNAILRQLHAGSARGVNEEGVGGYNTNTLILLHVPNDGGKATAFSIPRDDYVDYADAVGPQQHGKIKEAYGVTKAFTEQKLMARGVHDKHALEHDGREAARRSTISTVRKLLGVPIDHFAEINLAGFYDLATTLGGVDVCLKHPVQDHYSGADFPAGRQHLNGSQALAFVRQRHGLPNGDLDRTHRQQAFLASVTHKLKQDGIFGDLGRMRGLLKVARKDVVMDAEWDVLGFAQQARSLTGGNVEFHTLPIEGFGTRNRQSVNLVDPDKIRAMVHDTLDPPKQAPAPSASGSGAKTTVDVLNGGGHAGLAAKVAGALSQGGYATGKVANTAPSARTTVRYGGQDGADGPDGADAKKIAKLFGVKAVADPSLPAGTVRVVLGPAAVVPSLGGGGGSAPKPTATLPTTGAQGGAVKGGGIPCVD